MTDNGRRYIEWDYDNGVVREYKRKGECNSCGQCCKAFIKTNIAGIIEDQIEPGNVSALVGNGASHDGLWAEVAEDEHRWLIRIAEIDLNGTPCEALTGDLQCGFHTDKNVYKGHHALCDIWPMGPSQVTPFDDCSYEFEEIASWEIED